MEASRTELTWQGFDDKAKVQTFRLRQMRLSSTNTALSLLPMAGILPWFAGVGFALFSGINLFV